METKKVINRVNVESLFAALYAKGSTKLSDHYYNSEDDDESESDK